MKLLVRFVCAVLFSSWLMGTYAADVVRPGEYLAKNGELKVQRRNGKIFFAIFSSGDNGHFCDVSGRILGTVAQADEVSHPNCPIRMTPSLDGQEVTVVSPEDKSCQFQCGARAGVDDVYRIPPALCTKKGQRNARDLFIRRYRAKQFSQAVTALRPVLEQCGEFRRWQEEDSIRNDLSLAYFHLGKKEQCIDTLRANYESVIALKEALEATLGPGPRTIDDERYLPIAQATLHNMRLCLGEPGVQE